MNARAECDGVLDREPRIERSVAVLEHHLHLLAEGREIERARAHGFSVEQDVARIGRDDLHDQTRGGGLPAAGLADDAERLAFGDVEVDAVDGAHQRPGLGQNTGLAAKVLDQPPHRQQRRPRPAAIAQVRRNGRDAVVGFLPACAHCLTSIAERSPSENRLNEIEVRKIITPGRAATIGWV